MAIRVSGLISGLDTDSIVQELVSAYSTKKEKYEKAQTKQEWKMDAWKTMNSKIYGFYSSTLAPMKMSSAYNLKTCTASNSNVAKVTASSSAVNGTQKLKVTQLASSAYMTGGKVEQSDGSKVKGTTMLSSMGIKDGSEISVGDTNITITSDMTVNDLLGKLKGAGVNASFDENNQRIFVNANTSGQEGEFALIAGNVDGLGALQTLGLFAARDVDGNETAEMVKYRELAVSGNGAQKEVAQKIVTAFEAQNDENTIKNAQTVVNEYNSQATIVSKHNANQAIVDKWKAQQALVAKHANNIDDYRKILVKETKTVTNDDGSDETVDVRYTDSEIADMKKYLKDKVGSTDSEEINKYIQDNADSIDADELEKLKKYNDIVQAKTNLDEFESASAFVSNKDNESAKDAAQTALDEDALTDSKYSKAYAYVNDESNKSEYAKAQAVTAVSISSGAARISGQDAKITLNGAEFTSNTGTFSINGLSITAMQVTGADEEVSITTATDTQGIYDKIKSFIGKYNELITAMDTAYNAASAGDYEPLTDDEKDEMSDTEIEKWETKIKDSLLRRDSILGNASSSMKSIMGGTYEVNGKSYSLDMFGIGTLSYFTASTNERGCLHIDGDADDSSTSGNADKLMAAINEDPEAVTEFFQNLSTTLYNDLTKRMATSRTSSIYTIYNDKQMSSEYSEYKDKVSQWQEKLEYYEEFYYKKFSAMETAMSKLQSSTSSLSNLLGGS